MADILFSNNASSLLAATITDSDTVIQVKAGLGALFPSPSGGQYFVIALTNASGDLEICHCTSRSTDNLTVTRAQEGTVAQAWTVDVARVELRVTKGQMEAFLQRTGDVMSGDLDMDGNNLVDAVLTGSTVITGGQTVGTSIRGALNDTSNEIVVPGDGSRPTIGGSAIALSSEILAWALDANVVHDTGNETVAGVKTFSSAIVASAGVHADAGTAANPGYAFDDDTDTGMFRRGAADIGWACAGVERMFLTDAGDLTCDGDVTGTSDRRLKKNLRPITNALDKVMQLNGYTFERIGSDDRRVGVIAQEVEQVLPEAVRRKPDGYRTVAYGNMIGLLIEAIKELASGPTN